MQNISQELCRKTQSQKYWLWINTCSEMEACEVTLLVPLLLALRGSVTECLVISCDLTEGYCCSFPSLEGLVHLLKKNSEGWRYRAIRNKVFSIGYRWKQFMLTTRKKVLRLKESAVEKLSPCLDSRNSIIKFSPVSI